MHSSATGDDAAPTVFLFPGQGSQHHQMARELFDHEPDFRDLMLALDDDYARQHGRSLLDALLGQPARVPMDDIRISHPLVVMVEYALASTLLRRGMRPSLLLASSAGEFAAHAFAGRMSIERALEMMTHQAQTALQLVEPGFLAAVVAPATWYDATPEVRRLAYLAGRTFPGAIVLAGRQADWPAVEQLLRGHGLTSQRLPVQVPFHSPMVDPMRGPWLERFGADVMREGWVPVIGQCPDDLARRAYAEALWQVVREPLSFETQVQRLDRQASMNFVDVGPAGTLANWLRQVAGPRSAWRLVGLLSPWGGDRDRLRRVCPSKAAPGIRASGVSA